MSAETSTAAPVQTRIEIKERLLLIIIGSLVVLTAIMTAGYLYWLNLTLYVTTDNALVDPNMTAVSSPDLGTLKNWWIEPVKPRVEAMPDEAVMPEYF